MNFLIPDKKPTDVADNNVGKMTDNEIVKAWIVVLENKRMPTEYLINVTIDRINSLTAEVLRQQAKINVKNRLLDEAKAEIERLKRRLVVYEPLVDSGLFSQMLLEQKEKAEAFAKNWKAEAKSEAYREFAERLKKHYDEYDDYDDIYVRHIRDDIDFTLDDVVGDKNEKDT